MSSDETKPETETAGVQLELFPPAPEANPQGVPSDPKVPAKKARKAGVTKKKTILVGGTWHEGEGFRPYQDQPAPATNDLAKAVAFYRKAVPNGRVEFVRKLPCALVNAPSVRTSSKFE